MTLKKMYYYLFYKFYKLFEAFKTTRWLTDFKAGIVIAVLEIWLLFSVYSYIDVINGKRTEYDLISLKVILPSAIIFLIKWFAFVKDDSWKDYVKEFDEWPKEKNRKGTWVVVSIVLFVMGNLVFSLYLNPPPGGLRW
jgi:hypothetical protein